MNAILWAIVVGFILTNVSLVFLAYHLGKIITALYREMRHLREELPEAMPSRENSRVQMAP